MVFGQENLYVNTGTLRVSLLCKPVLEDWLTLLCNNYDSYIPFIVIRSIWSKEWLVLLLILGGAAHIETIEKGIHHLTKLCSCYCLGKSKFFQHRSHWGTKDLCSQVHSHHRIGSEVDVLPRTIRRSPCSHLGNEAACQNFTAVLPRFFAAQNTAANGKPR